MQHRQVNQLTTWLETCSRQVNIWGAGMLLHSNIDPPSLLFWCLHLILCSQIWEKHISAFSHDNQLWLIASRNYLSPKHLKQHRKSVFFTKNQNLEKLKKLPKKERKTLQAEVPCVWFIVFLFSIICSKFFLNMVKNADEQSEHSLFLRPVSLISMHNPVIMILSVTSHFTATQFDSISYALSPNKKEAQWVSTMTQTLYSHLNRLINDRRVASSGRVWWSYEICGFFSSIELFLQLISLFFLCYSFSCTHSWNPYSVMIKEVNKCCWLHFKWMAVGLSLWRRTKRTFIVTHNNTTYLVDKLCSGCNYLLIVVAGC